eukprot:6376049-Prymnesium_polylepis.1
MSCSLMSLRVGTCLSSAYKVLGLRKRASEPDSASAASFSSSLMIFCLPAWLCRRTFRSSMMGWPFHLCCKWAISAGAQGGVIIDLTRDTVRAKRIMATIGKSTSTSINPVVDNCPRWSTDGPARLLLAANAPPSPAISAPSARAAQLSLARPPRAGAKRTPALLSTHQVGPHGALLFKE